MEGHLGGQGDGLLDEVLVFEVQDFGGVYHDDFGDAGGSDVGVVLEVEQRVLFGLHGGGGVEKRGINNNSYLNLNL